MNPPNVRVVFPEIRLVTYDKDNKAQPAIAVSSEPIPSLLLENPAALKKALEPLLDLLLAHIAVRQGREGAGAWTIPENHDSHPSCSVAKQLINVIEAGKVGFKCTVTDDPHVKGRKFLIFQVDKPA